jgi:hypothetical protein
VRWRHDTKIGLSFSEGEPHISGATAKHSSRAYTALIGSTSVGSSSGAREPLTRFDIGQRCSFWLSADSQCPWEKIYNERGPNRASIIRLASATISSVRLFSRLEGLSANGRVDPGAKIAALQPLPTGLTTIRYPLYSMTVIDCGMSTATSPNRDAVGLERDAALYIRDAAGRNSRTIVT